MGFLKPDPPTPPDPTQTARAQTGTNVSTAVANAYLNNVNQNTPTGSLTYWPTTNFSWTDPSTGQTYSIPQFTASQTLTPQGQAIQSQREATQFNLAQMGNAQSARIGGILGAPFDPNVGAPSGGNAAGIMSVPGAATSYGQAGPIQSGLDMTGAADPNNIQTTYGPGDNFSQDRQNVQEALMARINPQLDIQQNKLQQQLADQGIRYGSEAYSNAFTPFNQQANDARFAAISQAGQEQQRMNQMAGALAAFTNQAQQQGYEQQLGQGAFANQAQNQQFQQNAAAGAFYNSGLAQQLSQQQAAFNAQQAQRNQYMQEAYQQRNQPLNEVTSLLSGSQMQQPNWLNTPQSQIPTTDYAGLINQNFNQQLGIYQQQNQQYNQLVGGTLGLGAGLIKASDERVKKDIEPIGSVLATEPKPRMATIFGDAEYDEGHTKQLPIYQYSYKGDETGQRHVGPMAQDVEKIDPAAVHDIGGIKHIDTRRVMGSILRAA